MENTSNKIRMCQNISNPRKLNEKLSGFYLLSKKLELPAIMKYMHIIEEVLNDRLLI